jgi:hypothetical protein
VSPLVGSDELPVIPGHELRPDAAIGHGAMKR